MDEHPTTETRQSLHFDDSGLWVQRANLQDPATREQLILLYMPLVYSVVNRLGLAGGTEYEDLVSQGMVGLIYAVDRYDPARGVRFTTFATHYIQGRVKDGLRGLDLLSRTTRRRLRQIESAAGELEHRLGRAPAEAEVAARTGLDLEKMRRARQDARRKTLSLDTAAGPDDDWHDSVADVADDDADPMDALLDGDLTLRLRQRMAELPGRELEILSLRYDEGLSVKEIADRLQLTEARVSQIHARAVLALRAQLDQEGPAQPGS